MQSLVAEQACGAAGATEVVLPPSGRSLILLPACHGLLCPLGPSLVKYIFDQVLATIYLPYQAASATLGTTGRCILLGSKQSDGGRDKSELSDILEDQYGYGIRCA